MNYRFIVLMTDFGQKDHFAGVLKGTIHRINPLVRIIDLTHQIEPQNIIQAGFLLRHSWPFFPDRSLFLSIVDPGVGTDRNIILIEKGKQLFMAPDNGLLSFLEDEGRIKRYKVRMPNKFLRERISATFHGRDILAPLSAHISKGVPLREIAVPIQGIKRIETPEVKIEKNQLIGHVIYADHFGNLITDISRELFFEFVKLRASFFISLGHYKISQIEKNYTTGEKIGALFNSFDLLEIFAPARSAKDLLKINLPSEIRIMVR